MKSPIIVITLRAKRSVSEGHQLLTWGTTAPWEGRVSLPSGFVCDLVESNAPCEGIALLSHLEIASEDGKYANPVLHGDGALDARLVNRLGIAFGPCEPNRYLRARGTWENIIPCPYVTGQVFPLGLVLRGRIER